MIVIHLSEEFLAQYRGRNPEWGFDGLGYVVYKRTYARYLEEEGRTEEWWETCKRVVEGNLNLPIMPDGSPDPTVTQQEAEELYDALFHLGIVLSGRNLWMSGTEYAKRTIDANNNCWATSVRPQTYDIQHVNHFHRPWPLDETQPRPSFPFAFTLDELAKGGGVGAGIQSRHVREIPPVAAAVDLRIAVRTTHPQYNEVAPDDSPEVAFDTITVADSREGWFQALAYLVDAHFNPAYDQQPLIIDVSEIRAYGEPIRGFGGKASGPGPFVQLLRDANKVLNQARGRQLRPTEAGDIIQMTGRCIVAGNVRRSALILIGDADDQEFIESKDYSRHMEASLWRWASNNSVEIRSTTEDFTQIAQGIYLNGEPGIFGLDLSQNYGRIIDDYQEGIDGEVEATNPCGEISLPNGSPCNLAEVAPSRCDDLGLSVERAIELVTRYAYRITFGHYDWAITRDIVGRHRRLGVSLTGTSDWFLKRFGHGPIAGWNGNEPVYHQDIVDALDRLYHTAKRANLAHAEALGTNPSIKITTNKPSGSTSLLAGVAPGIHAHWSPYMIRRVQFGANDPLIEELRRCGYPIEPRIMGRDADGTVQYDPRTVVVEFPIHAPSAEIEGFQSSGELTLREQAATQALFAKYWADNAVSATLSFHKAETSKGDAAVIQEITDILRQYRTVIKSTSLLPYAAGTYDQMPLEAISQAEYQRRRDALRGRPWDRVMTFDIQLDEALDDPSCTTGTCPIR